jgi:adenine-specific DNA-methyltransferase
MNFKRKEIEKFIEQDLIVEAERQFQEYNQAGQADLKSEVDKLRAEIVRDFGEGTLDSVGNVKKNEDAPKVKLYLDKKKLLEEAKVTQSQISDVFNHIYEFFSRYYDKGDFIPKRRYGGKNKYYIPYNGEEVALYWATKDMYYVKTGEFFKKYSFRTGRYLVTFVLTEAKVEVGNIKGEKKYFLLSPDDPVTIDDAAGLVEIRFNYRGLSEEESSRLGKLDVQATLVNEAIEKIASMLKDSAVVGILKPRAEGEKPLLEKHLNSYVERNTRDFFIHKNLKGFLESELDFYLKNEVWSLSDLEAADENGAKILAAKAKAIHNIAAKIIEFLNQIEDFQKKLYEKKKLVLRTDYCITLDRVPVEFYEEIGRNERQVQEWKQLFKLDEITKNSLQNTVGKPTLDENFLKTHKYLVLDTAFFPEEFKFRLLESYDNLDEVVGGVIIKSENYQALNLLRKKYRDKIACIYIDPPYNTGNDEFVYKDNYQHSSWISLLLDRAELSREMLSDKGSIFVSCDDNELSRLNLLLSSVYGATNFIATIIWKKVHTRKNSAKYFSVSHDYIPCFAKNRSSWKRILLPREDLSAYSNPDNNPKGPWKADPVYANNPYDVDYIITKPSGVQLKPPRGRFWRFSEKKFKEKVAAGDVIWGEGSSYPLVKRYLSEVQQGLVPVTFFDIEFAGDNAFAAQEFRDMFGNAGLISYPKPTKLIQRLAQLTSTQEDIVLDFFAGSGTTGHAILNLNNKDGSKRKYILVEMADYFEALLKPRIQKVMYSKEWKEGKPASNEGISHFFKYMVLEQYEDALNNIVFKTTGNTIQETLLSFDDYFLHYMLDYETRESPTRLMVDRFVKPFDYKIRTINSTEEKTVAVDLVETFNYLLGLTVEKFQRFIDNERIYRVVFGKLENQSVCVIWRDLEQIDLEKDKQFIESKILASKNFDFIYVNGDSYVKNARPIEPEFKRLMGA